MPGSPTASCAIGVDGCRDGWIAAIKEPRKKVRWHFAATINELLEAAPLDATILVDMIIGLPDAQTPDRVCDREARRRLSPHGSRVFPAPPREALQADNYEEACALARKATGKAISKQAFNLFSKIRELDAVSDPRIRESHPEVVFARLNGGEPVAASKKTPHGRNQRLRLLESILKASEAILRADLELPKVRFLKDDCVDALALCAAAMRPRKLQRLPETGDGPSIWY